MNRQNSQKDKILMDRLEDMAEQSSRSSASRFTFFLDEGQLALAQNMLQLKMISNYRFFGGYEGAGRCMVGFFPEYGEDVFPIVPITFTFRSESALSHRDFLGALMAMRIKRELIGDILTGEGFAVAFLTKVAAQLALTELTKVGKVGVKLEEGLPVHLPKAFDLAPVTGTVPSMRLDCVIALIGKLSRDKAATLIKSGAVSVNFFESTQINELLKEGDVLSVRGSGRYVVSEIGGESKKGRFHLTCNKYV